MTDSFKKISNNIKSILNRDLTFSYCLLNSFSAKKARNLYNAYVKTEENYLKNSTCESHDKCYDNIVLQFTKCKVKGVFEAIARTFAFIITLPLDIFRSAFTLSTKEFFKYTSANAIAIADSFFKPEHYAKLCKDLDRARRHSPKAKVKI